MEELSNGIGKNILKKDYISDAILACPECHSSNIIRDQRKGELICQDCGLVIYDNLMLEERGYVNFKDKNEPIGFGDYFTTSKSEPLSETDIGKGSRDIQGNKLSNAVLFKFHNLRRLNQRIKNAKGTQRNLAVALVEFNRLAAVISISKEVKEEALNIYKDAVKNYITHGKKIVALVAASIYAASRIKGVPRTIKEISTYSKATKLEITRAYTALNRSLKLKIPLLTPDDFIIRYMDDLKLPSNARKKVYEYSKIVERNYHTSSVLPNGIIATIIYITCIEMNIGCSQGQIASIASVTPVTIRNHYKELKDIIHSA